MLEIIGVVFIIIFGVTSLPSFVISMSPYTSRFCKSMILLWYTFSIIFSFVLILGYS